MERSESEIIKELAINGKFIEIAEQFGTKRVAKAEAYVQAKLDSLRNKTAEGLFVAGVSYATPFMMYAVVQEGNQIVNMAKKFVEQGKADTESDLELLSQPSSQLRKTPSQSSKADEDDVVTPPKDQVSISVVTPVRPAKSFHASAVIAPEGDTSKKGKKTVKVGKEKASKEKKAGKKDSSASKKEKPPKASKQGKDPDAPKKAKAAYMFFLAHIRTVLLQENSTMGITDIAKEAGVRWKALSEEEKEPFVAQAMQDKARYTEEMESYTEKHPDYEALKKRKGGHSSKKSKKKARHAKEEGEDNAEEDNMETEADDDSGGGGDASQRECTQRKAAKVASKGIAQAVHSEIIHEPSAPTTTKKRMKRLHKSATVSPDDATGGVAIKQEDLDSQEDLLHSNLKPYDTCAYPDPLVFSKGMAVSLALEPYRAFLADLAQDSFDPTVLQDIQRVCALQQPIVQATVKAFEHLPVGTSAQEQYTLLTLSVSGTQRGQYKVLYADLASPLLISDTFLVETAKLRTSLEAPWLFVNAQVRRLFATADPAVAEWQEGSVYYIRDDIKENPYRAVHVVWLQQERGTNHWLYSFCQTDIECSPWDLEPSTYVLPEKVTPPSIPRSLLVGALDPALILEYLKTLDGARLFLADMAQCMDPEYCDMFPDPDQRLCMPALARLCRQGRYSDAESSNSPQSYLGILALFTDLQRMVAQSKAFNASNRAFLPWRMAEMLERAVGHLKSVLAERRGIACLQNSLREDCEAEMDLMQLSQAVDV